MLTLCCPFIEYNPEVKRTLNSFKEFINKANKLGEDLKISILGITSTQKDLQNNELNSLVDIIEFVPKKGIYFAFNYSVKKSLSYNSNWLWILGGGDTIYKPNIQLLNELTKNKNNEIIIVGAIKIGNRKNINKHIFPKTKIWQNLDKMRLNHPAMIISSLAYKKIGLYNQKLKIIADYEWCLKALKAKTKFIKVEKTFTYHELGGASTSYGKSRLTLHLSCIMVILKQLRCSYFLPIAIVLRIGRFLLSRFIHYSKLINSNVNR